MKEIVEDLFKIYISAIDSYNSKIMQTINEKYTIIDKSMFATYIYIKILENAQIDKHADQGNLRNYLLKQIIYGETGNLALEISNQKVKKSYDEVSSNLIKEKFEYKNKIISKLKYYYEDSSLKEYKELLEFCEQIAEYSILDRIIKTGNTYVQKEFEDRKKSIIKVKEQIQPINEINKEQIKIIASIENNSFDTTEYSKLLEVAFNLRDVYRYSTLTTTIPENVLFHQYTIAVSSIIFSDYLNKELEENIDIEEIIYKSLFHDFAEYKGNEIVTQVKNYNEDTIKLFAELEEVDEQELKEKVGETIYKLINTYKTGKEGLVSEMLDKILGIAKLLVEVGYMNNYTYIKSICSIYQARFKRFNKIYKMEELKNKEFLMDLLRESYIYIKENMKNANSKYLKLYFNDKDIEDMEQELEDIKNNPEHFLA